MSSQLRSPLRRWRAYYAGVLLLLDLPILLFVVFSFNNATSLVLPLRGFTLQWHANLEKHHALVGAVGNSLLVDLLASARHRTGRPRCICHGAPQAARPQPVFGHLNAAARNPLSHFGIRSTNTFQRAGPAALHLHRRPCARHREHALRHSDHCSAPGWLHTKPGGGRHGSGRFLDASYLLALLRITLPICSPALPAAFLLCFTISFDEYSISSFLAGTDTTLHVYLSSHLRFPTRLPMVVALASILIATTVRVALLSECLRRVGQLPARSA